MYKQMDMPLVSVLVPVYNGSRYMEETIRTVQAQTYRNIEIIICNDASTDQSLEIARRLAAEDDRIIVVQNDKNSGISVSRNHMISIAKGKYISLLDCDDLWLPRKLEKQIRFMEAHPLYGICGTWASKIDKDGVAIPGAGIMPPVNDGEIAVNMLFQTSMVQSSTLIRMELGDRLYYNPEFWVCEDFEAVERMSAFTRIHNIPEFLVRYRIFPDSISQTKSERLIKARRSIIKRRLERRFGNITDKTVELMDDIGSLKKVSAEKLVSAEKILKQLVAENNRKKVFGKNLFIAFLWYRWMRFAFKNRSYVKGILPTFRSFSPVVLMKLSRLFLRILFKI